jgi:4-hydroxy-tetrahydrodipicolinate reductase
MIKVGVVGASGRTGSQVVAALLESQNSSLHAAIVSPGSARLGAAVAATAVCYSSELSALAGSDVVIDFSVPESSLAVATWCAAQRVPVVVATTGHTLKQLDSIRALATSIPVVIAPNTSLGAAAVSLLSEVAKQMLGDSFDIEVLEIHHRGKKDAPSGTAKAIVEPLSRNAEVVFGREGLRKSGEIGVVSLRGGDVAGEHTVYFLGHGERIELSHRVTSREVFGRGAVYLAEKARGLKPGVYSARDLLAKNVGESRA